MWRRPHSRGDYWIAQLAGRGARFVLAWFGQADESQPVAFPALSVA